MINVNNWDERRSHYEDYWNYRNKIPVLNITAAIDNANMEYETPENDMSGWYDADYMSRDMRRYSANTYFGADSYPYISPSLGPDIVSGILGFELKYNETSSWVTHKDCPLSDFTDFTIDPNNFYLKKMDEMLNKFAEDAKNGDYIVGMVDLNTLLDGLSSFIGPANLCFELIDNPDEVKRVTWEHLKVFKQLYTRFNNIVTRYQGGNTNWLGVYSDIPWYYISNDFMVMVSGDHFDEFVAEPLKDMAKFHGRNLFHLDGENMTVHLDKLCAIKELTGIQVQATPYMQSAEFWIPHIKKIQKAGKCTWIDAQSEEEVMQLIKNLEPEGLYIRTWSHTEAEARETERKMKQYYGK